jgi:hypothetical protein
MTIVCTGLSHTIIDVFPVLRIGTLPEHLDKTVYPSGDSMVRQLRELPKYCIYPGSALESTHT